MPAQIVHLWNPFSCPSYCWHLFIQKTVASQCDKNRLARSLTSVRSTNYYERKLFLTLIASLTLVGNTQNYES